jgi:RND family efflux transporter MFP subunit
MTSQPGSEVSPVPSSPEVTTLSVPEPKGLLAEAKAAVPNGQAKAFTTRLPQAQRRSARTKFLLATGLLLLVAGAAAAAYMVMGKGRNLRTDLVTHTVKHEKLLLTIVERGALESENNNDIQARVKAGTKNSTVATTIKSVIDDGSHVKKGDLLVELDDSGLIEQLKSEKITLDTAEANKVQAEEAYKITQSQNESDIKSAEVNLQLKEIDLKKYIEGDYPQALKDVQGQISMAESDMEQQRDRSAWAQRMVKKGYYTPSQAQAEQSKLEGYDLTLKKLIESKRVLTDYTKLREETARQNDVAEAKRALERTKSQAAAKETQARTDKETKKSIWEQEKQRYVEIEEEIKKCKIYSPQDGMVVYYVSEQTRFGSGSQQSIVAQGEPVREGQKLMRIPDLGHMLVNTRVHEAMVSRLSEGQPASIRIDAFPDQRLQGYVKSVATVAAQQDWMTADVKVYTTMVAIDGTVEGLKPGMSAEVTILTDGQSENVLTVPVQAIITTTDLGQYRKCFVKLPTGETEERQIEVGLANEKMAEIKSGLKEGEKVVLNPKVLLSEQERAKLITGDKLVSTGKGNLLDKAGKMGKGKGKGGDGPAGKGGPGAGGPPAGGQGGPSAEDRQKMLDKFKTATPEGRKQMLEQVPEAYRDRVRQSLESQGMKVAD